MVTPSAGSVVTVRFPFSDLSQSKLRPAVVLADAGRSDWILCQVTSKSYADPSAVKLVDEDFASGALSLTSYARPGKLKDDAFRQVAGSVVSLLQSHIP